ncbi:MAG: TM1802 family CRISPR-associated protein [Thermoguttaceae bacterium]
MIFDMYKHAKAYVEAGAAFGPDTKLTSDQQRLALLSEPHEARSPVYVLYRTAEGVARLDRRELDDGESWRLPFIKVAPNAAYLTPVFKVERKKGISESKRRTTNKLFSSLRELGGDTADYFTAVVEVLESTLFCTPGCADPAAVTDAFGAAVAAVVKCEERGAHGGSAESKKLTPLLCVAVDANGDVWPGDDTRHVRWLLATPERATIYQSTSLADPDDAECPLTGQRGRLYSNALAGAGLNFVNGDFRGSFPAQREELAWVRAGLSAEAADMLYIYKNHVAPDYFDNIAGSKALVIPSANISDDVRRIRFYDLVKRTIGAARRENAERAVLRRFSDEASVAAISIVWASFGQKFEDARGFISGILPSRLADLERVNDEYNRRQSMLFPRNNHYRRMLDLNLQLAAELLYRVGGAGVKRENQSQRRHGLLRELAGCVYHGHPLQPQLLWREIDATARAYLVMLLNNSELAGYQAGYEGPAKVPKGRLPALTLNGWVRHWALILNYLSDPRIGVLEREEGVYKPKNEGLAPLFENADGLNTPAKQYVFLLGVLYGHLIYVQGDLAKFNVGAGALRLLRGGRIRADELDKLYKYTWMKLLEYEQASGVRYGISKRVHEINNELGILGIQLGDTVGLPDEKVPYYLMLGMALSYDFTKTEKSNGDNTKGGNQ